MTDDSRATGGGSDSGELPAEIRRAFEHHEAVKRTGEGFSITTTAFDVTVAADASAEPPYSVTVVVPTLQAATEDAVGPTVATDWFETFERRLESAPGATRANVDLDEFDVVEEGDTVRVEYGFAMDNPRTAVDVAKAFAEFVEGTYVEGLVPGYTYRSPVADLLAEASQGEGGGTPL